MKIPWAAAGAAVLAGALAAGAVDWTVGVKRAEVKSSPKPFAKPSGELELGKSVEGVQEGEWVRLTEKGSEGWVHRTALVAEGDEVKDPFLAFRVMGRFYPEDVQATDAPAAEWMRDPVVGSTGPAPRSWALEDFRSAGGLGSGK